ncbi:phospholipase A2 inhibitor and Ly6/PLAUR domain-containing protein-like [Hyla sarda]|uniref:phospholipase A2 inhibitor and Ly6/PLAUR domain-containing protein-like n=1 Tax=Hyla sarda TaxID=327740 RepID=UPI0024C441BA|nr:phospholipase A2 inhibitor and Ly6/PLAUR domain-containing protein-like [Hyla sarda]XP_056399088.1 phospholipase A2 inhibitor and Ly6/PLAUR domain-containing protein-like [Hyla sarda]XP_056399089.1 phospholipase A2 inhibitor and Ly6/PLAUR domain-containing protein-like [Hyla sarda]XP_056399090.1 phospholipase A2 inhibitor and Ly6/PLAUR domain-containing protein-like [Hyla sarda]XP_056399091.1 phospholipase A2 inhibitor and Ly6/PLAUR domain-containing protein-like [Hyla sarda]XP_056399092.1 
MTISEEYKNMESYHSIYKGCSGDLPCDKKLYSMTNDSLYLMTNLQCCDTDLCNDQFYEMPEDEKPHGGVCPSCIKFNTLEECKANNKLKCLQKDDKCVSFSAEVEKPDGVAISYSAKGCMSALECERLSDLIIGIKMLNGGNFECKNPPSKKEKHQEEN